MRHCSVKLAEDTWGYLLSSWHSFPRIQDSHAMSTADESSPWCIGSRALPASNGRG